eukprot:1199161-Pyramimonas_sp.AAC.1
MPETPVENTSQLDWSAMTAQPTLVNWEYSPSKAEPSRKSSPDGSTPSPLPNQQTASDRGGIT